MTTFGDQLYQYGGVPVNGQMTTGNVFFVSSVRTNMKSDTGDRPDRAFSTMDQATNACTANKNDIVYVMPNHTEALAATTWVPDVAGVQYIGIGLGADAPEFTFGATTSIISISGANSMFQNMRFIATTADVVCAVDILANHITMDHCVWDFESTGEGFLVNVDIDTIDYTTITNCRFIAENAGGVQAAAITLDAADHTIIKDNLFSGDFSFSVIASKTTDAASLSVMILDNMMYNDDAATTNCGGIALACAATGVIKGNMIGTLSSGADAGPGTGVGIDPGSCLMFENYVSSQIDHYGSQALTGTAST